MASVDLANDSMLQDRLRARSTTSLLDKADTLSMAVDTPVDMASPTAVTKVSRVSSACSAVEEVIMLLLTMESDVMTLTLIAAVFMIAQFQLGVLFNRRQ